MGIGVSLLMYLHIKVHPVLAINTLVYYAYAVNMLESQEVQVDYYCYNNFTGVITILLVLGSVIMITEGSTVIKNCCNVTVKDHCFSTNETSQE